MSLQSAPPWQSITQVFWLTLQSTKFHCSAHGADFSLTGAVLDGPTSTALPHYTLCLLANGNVGLQTTKVASTVRLNV